MCGLFVMTVFARTVMRITRRVTLFIAMRSAVITRLIIGPVGPMRFTPVAVTAIVGAAIGIAIPALVIGAWGVVVGTVIGLYIVSDGCDTRLPGNVV